MTTKATICWLIWAASTSNLHLECMLSNQANCHWARLRPPTLTVTILTYIDCTANVNVIFGNASSKADMLQQKLNAGTSLR